MTSVREERPADYDAIREVIASAFGQIDEARLVDALRSAGDLVLSLVRVEDGRVIAHLALSRMAAPFPALALAPVSVIPAAQRRGIGSALIRAAVDRARDGGWAAIFVLGDPTFYERFGFDVNAAKNFATPYAGAHFMALALGGGLPCDSGPVEHGQAFAELD